MDQEQLRHFCAQFWQVELSRISLDLRLDDPCLPHNTSIRFYQFIAALERQFKVRVNNIDTIITFGNIFQGLERPS